MSLRLDLPETHPFYIYIGNDVAEPFGFIDENGTPIDLTGWGIKAQLRTKQKRTATLLADFVVDRTHETEGLIALTLTDIVSGSLVGHKGFYDILLTDLNGFDETYIGGMITFLSTVTVK